MKLTKKSTGISPASWCPCQGACTSCTGCQGCDGGSYSDGWGS